MQCNDSSLHGVVGARGALASTEFPKFHRVGRREGNSVDSDILSSPRLRQLRLGVQSEVGQSATGAVIMCAML